jgi:hypothetical protein
MSRAMLYRYASVKNAAVLLTALPINLMALLNCGV